MEVEVKLRSQDAQLSLPLTTYFGINNQTGVGSIQAKHLHVEWLLELHKGVLRRCRGCLADPGSARSGCSKNKILEPYNVGLRLYPGFLEHKLWQGRLR